MRALRLALVGPLPPPSGGMANQCRQLARLLGEEGVEVEVVQVNAPYRPAFVEKLKGIRALFRLIPYKWALWRAAGRADVVHVMANSGWSWYLFAVPAVYIARLRGTPVIINYRGGGAAEFFAHAPALALRALKKANALIVPSGFLREVFGQLGCTGLVIPNIIDLSRFTPRQPQPGKVDKHVIVTRNLEPIYDIPTALQAFARVRQQLPSAQMTVAGSGPELANLQQLAQTLGIADAVHFVGRIDNDQMSALYTSADLMLNPSTIDNMPISILEAFASNVPVVSTDVGGVPFIAEHGRTALLVPARDADAMAAAMLQILQDDAFAEQLSTAGMAEAQRYAWPVVREQWLAAYRGLMRLESR
ncbi:glycosyltransferase involved in cell wall biosynthesis [Chitinivorax tropicus]|uniref:Glycosyltransferase involved in cell wall biosynthesis n=1 Tax=Chitinivorax tropicus TaxID=714531 RepID=A0A840MPE2_9PROT|nr:glycosyltransferase family 4 protein [Chitinivorax tropicus]MBB5018887.1 glycosyltransferase involved in cell wall biosynthesis [Chitinivorax tropicus]